MGRECGNEKVGIGGKREKKIGIFWEKIYSIKVSFVLQFQVCTASTCYIIMIHIVLEFNMLQMVVLMDVVNMVNAVTFLMAGSVHVTPAGQEKDVMLPWRWFVMTWRIMIEVKF